MRFSAVILAPLALALQASAHGFVASAVIDGKTYKGNGDGGDPSSTAIRPTKPNDVGPVKGASNADLSCGLSPVSKAALVADAMPGSKIDILWQGQGHINWIHKVGPVLHYMAECTGVKDCTTFDAADAKWFKIAQQGYKADGTTWFMEDLYDGKPVSLTLPKNIKAGNYLLRTEVIALHNAVSVGGAEFYPNCVQLAVGGSGTGVPSSTVKFPGAYSDTDAGIVVPDIFNPGFKYDFPGPPVASLGGSAAPGDAAPAKPSKAASTSTEKAAPTTTEKAAPSPTKPVRHASTAAASSVSLFPPQATPTASGHCKASNRQRRAAQKAKRAHHAARMFGKGSSKHT